ncbi:MAG: hypothetical protein ABWZ40_14175, partial [Caulobacterales bacterium]
MAASKKNMFDNSDAPAKSGRKSEKSRVDERVVDLNEEAERRVERLKAEPEAKTDHKVEHAGSWATWFTLVLSLTWLGGVGAFIAGYYTPEQLIALPTPIALGGGLMIFGVAMLIWFMGFVMRETARTRAMSRRLAAAADVLLAPAAVSEASSKRLAGAIRNELAGLDRALSETAAKLQSLEQTVTSQSRALTNAATSVETQTRNYADVADTLDSKARMIEDTVTRHTTRVGDAFGAAQNAARDIEARIVGTSDNLKANSEAILAKSEQLTFLAKQVNQKANSLDVALDSALKTLATASHLVDAAKASTGMATDASKSAADAVRAAISDSIERARAVAEQIKAEHLALQDSGQISIQAIKQAADIARGATDTLTQHSERRIQELSQSLQDAVSRADRAAEQRIDQARRVVERTGSAYEEVQDRSGPKKQVVLPPEPEFKAKPAAGKGKPEDSWRWKDVLADAEAEQAVPVPANSTQPAVQPIDKLTDALSAAGVSPFQAISDSRLKDILKRGGDSVASRRWAVWDAAPDALRKAKAALSLDAGLREAARTFLTDEGRRQQNAAYFASASGRLYLILDAAL